MRRSSRRPCPASTMTQRGVPSGSTLAVPTRKRATSSIGFWVAERPMRSRPPASSSRRSSESARCDPRLSSATAWISSTITVRTVFSIPLPPSLVRRMNSDSGVVTRMCGGRLTIAVRTLAGVSPVRTWVRIPASGSPMAASSPPIPASGSTRFFSMSFDSAFRGET